MSCKQAHRLIKLMRNLAVKLENSYGDTVLDADAEEPLRINKHLQKQYKFAHKITLTFTH